MTEPNEGPGKAGPLAEAGFAGLPHRRATPERNMADDGTVQSSRPVFFASGPDDIAPIAPRPSGLGLPGPIPEHRRCRRADDAPRDRRARIGPSRANPGPSLRAPVNAKCRDCSYDPKGGGTWREQVAACSCPSCPLYPVRPLPTGMRHGSPELAALIKRMGGRA
jgi:hypothetical protein